MCLPVQCTKIISLTFVHESSIPHVSCCTTPNNPRILHTIPNSLSPKIIIELNRLLVSPYVLELPPFMYCNHLPYLFPIFCCPCSLLYHTKFAFAKRFHNLYTVWWDDLFACWTYVWNGTWDSVVCVRAHGTSTGRAWGQVSSFQ